MSQRRKLQRQHKLANPRTALPEIQAPAEDPSCPSCGGEGDEEGPCGSCGQNVITCWGHDVDSDEDEAEPLHETVSWNAAGQSREGDLCPSCA